MEFYPSKTSLSDERVVRARFLGTGGVPTIECGQRLSVSRVSAGLYRVTFGVGIGTFCGIGGYCFGAATPGDVKGQTMTRDTYDATNNQLDLAIWSSGFAADDLQATEYLDVNFVFTENSEVL